MNKKSIQNDSYETALFKRSCHITIRKHQENDFQNGYFEPKLDICHFAMPTEESKGTLFQSHGYSSFSHEANFYR